MHAYVQGQGGGGGGRAVNSTREQPRGRYNDGYERRGNEQSSPNKIIISSTRSNFQPFLPSSLVGGFLLRADRAANNRGVFRKCKYVSYSALAREPRDNWGARDVSVGSLLRPLFPRKHHLGVMFALFLLENVSLDFLDGSRIGRKKRNLKQNWKGNG